jgi:hypothetical protein
LSATNPHQFKDTSLHDQKYGVFCAIPRNRLLGPISLEDIINS